jgi:NADH dehydrogenase
MLDMGNSELNVVTGAFSYTGKYITQRLLSMGEEVRTLTGRPDRENPFGRRVRAFPFNFDRPGELTDSLRGAKTLYNTYWVRYPRGHVSFDKAVENSKKLIAAAEAAGIRRIVYISITNPSEDSQFPYFRGKALVEKTIIQSKLSYAIIRPTVIFGPEGILINNIAWLLRKSPIFAIPGSGDYQIQPVFVEDVAEIAFRAGQQDDNAILDAVGPETFTFDQLVRMIAGQINSRAKIVHVRPSLALVLAKLIGCGLRDVVITRDEIDGLMSNLLISETEATTPTLFSEWLNLNADRIGRRYICGLERRYRD